MYVEARIRYVDGIEFVVKMVNGEADLIVFIDVVSNEKIGRLGFKAGSIEIADGRAELVALFIASTSRTA